MGTPDQRVADDDSVVLDPPIPDLAAGELAIAAVEGRDCVEDSCEDIVGCMDSYCEARIVEGPEECASPQSRRQSQYILSLVASTFGLDSNPGICLLRYHPCTKRAPLQEPKAHAAARLRPW